MGGFENLPEVFGEVLKTSRKFPGGFENFSGVFGEVIVSLRIDAPEMSKLPRS